jgi:hypothetical protein
MISTGSARKQFRCFEPTTSGVPLHRVCSALVREPRQLRDLSPPFSRARLPLLSILPALAILICMLTAKPTLPQHSNAIST